MKKLYTSSIFRRSLCRSYSICQQKTKLDVIKLNKNRQEFENLLTNQSSQTQKLTVPFTNTIFKYMNRRMQQENYEMTDQHLKVLKQQVDQDSGLWFKLFAENEIVVDTKGTKKLTETPVFYMGQFFHWSFVQQVKPYFFDTNSKEKE
ncbi:MAG: hypothetical protein AB8E82_15980 [Aureispira sp.]